MNWQCSSFVFWGDMRVARSRPLVKALAMWCDQAGSCHAGLRCHALSSDWVTVQREKVKAPLQHGCHSHLPTARYKHNHPDTHEETMWKCTPSKNPQENPRSFEIAMCIKCFELFYSCAFKVGFRLHNLALNFHSLKQCLDIADKSPRSKPNWCSLTWASITLCEL